MFATAPGGDAALRETAQLVEVVEKSCGEKKRHYQYLLQLICENT